MTPTETGMTAEQALDDVIADTRARLAALVDRLDAAVELRGLCADLRRLRGTPLEHPDDLLVAARRDGPLLEARVHALLVRANTR